MNSEHGMNDGGGRGLDSETAHELVAQMRDLTSEVVRLRTSFDIYGPMLDSQVNGLADVTNRQTKMESSIVAVQRELSSHCSEQKDDEREDRESRRWQIAQMLVGVGAVTAIVQVLIGMVGHK